MSEHAPRNHEQHEQAILDPEREIEAHSRVVESAPSEAEAQEKLEQARIEAEQTASERNPVEALQAAEKASEAPSEQLHVDHELKGITLRRELQNIRRKETGGERTLSRIIHQPVVRAVSEATGKTVSRPSGMLGGGIVAFLGTSIYLFYARHMGFRYSYVVFTVLFIGGFALGLILELLVWLALTPRRHQAAE